MNGKKVIFILIVGLLIVVSCGYSYGYDWLDGFYSSSPLDDIPSYGGQAYNYATYPPPGIPEIPNITELPFPWPPESPGSPCDSTTDCNPQNNPPVAVDDTASTTCNTPVNIDVLANDNDLDGDTLSIYRIVNPPAHGSATIDSSAVIYTPNAGFSGTDSFTYKVKDCKGGWDIACVTITVTCQPPAPNPCQQCGPGYGGKSEVYFIKVTYSGMTAEAKGECDKGSYKKLKSNTTLTFSNGAWVEVHTSCSQPLYVGMTVPVYMGKYKKNSIGTATVTNLIISPCQPSEPCCETCEPSCTSCGMGKDDKGEVYSIEVTRYTSTGEAQVALAEGEWKNGKQKKLKANTKLVFDDGSWVEVHTSCSQPLYVGLNAPVYIGKDKRNPIGYAEVTSLLISCK